MAAPEPGLRVVSLIASSTEMVCALGRGGRLVARSHECDHPAWVRDLPQVTRPKFALDGGAMFSVVPRVLWERHFKPDHLNRIRLG